MKKPAYKIKNVDHLDPFLMSLTSSDNHWMFISSNGSLTAGREKADHALFPYITDNLIHTSLNTTGPKTKINIYKNKRKHRGALLYYKQQKINSNYYTK